MQIYIFAHEKLPASESNAVPLQGHFYKVNALPLSKPAPVHIIFIWVDFFGLEPNAESKAPNCKKQECQLFRDPAWS